MSNDEGGIFEARRLLVKWGIQNQRAFPWRNTRNPYRILVAEVFLHRTRADQVEPVYIEFLRVYPDVHTLADASLARLKELMGSLGLMWRIPLLKQMAVEIVERFRGEVPADADSLLALPGVGPYIASATVCFAFDRPAAILDTNTVRILGRITGVPITDSSRRSRRFREMMWDFLDKSQPRAFNLALLDLGALVCLPRNPQCPGCPLTAHCTFGRNHVNEK
jgi:A/G-specific adenine glycosylase